MIVCPRCDKDNQDHYKFCLGCGAELPRDAAKSPEGFTAPTPPAGVPLPAPAAGAPQFGGAAAPAPAAPTPAAPAPAAPAPAQFGGAAAEPAPAFGGAPAVSAPEQGAPAPAAAPADAGPLKCPNCAGDVPVNFKFCGTCGHNMTEAQTAAASAAPAAAAPAAAAPVADARGNLVLIRPDGTEGESYPLTAAPTIIGRDTAGPFASDAYLSPQHAEFSFDGDTLVISDKDSLNGIYRKIAPEQPVPLSDGTVFRVGQEIMRFEELPADQTGADGADLMGSPNPGFLGRIRLVVGRDSYGGSYCVPPNGMHLGRDRGDIIFPDDGYVSGLHCRIHGEPGSVHLTDVGSSNGTFIRLDEPTPLPTGSLLLMGMQLFRVEY